MKDQAHKTDTEEVPLKETQQVKPVPQLPTMVPYFSLMRFATKQDKIMMWIGGFAALANGACMPLFALIFGDMTNSFQYEGEKMFDEALKNAIWFLVIAVGTFILSFIMFSTWMITGERQSIEYRKHYFKSILSQEIGWFDTINPNELSSKVANETFAVQGAIGEKFPTFIMTFSTTFFGFLIGYIKGWQLAIIITASIPAMSIATAIFTKFITTSFIKTQQAYSDAGAMAEQAINAIKTVKMLDGEDFECVKYSRCLKDAAEVTIKLNLGVGLSLGLLWAVILWSYSLGFWYGAKLIGDQTLNNNSGDVYTVGDVMTIFFAVLTGGFSIGQIGPCFQNFASGRISAVKIFEILERKPMIINPERPKKLDNFNGEITLQNVSFRYPNRQDQLVLDELSLTIPAGKKVALVGESGCGKSTIMQLIERFYDSNSGEVSFGGEKGVNVKELDLIDLRGRIGMVGQEPVLFATSIRENLLYGNPDATEEDMRNALIKVNAWDFIEKMDSKLDTYVGIGGSQLSGGQKQRIAIARAILKKPQVLLLDEATSALDRTNEKLIQTTLDEVSKGITTIIIAHRLTTIQNADLIYVIDKGKVVEKGTHSELMNLHGKYEQLAKNQISEHSNQQQDDSGSVSSSGSPEKTKSKKLPSKIALPPIQNQLGDSQKLIEVAKDASQAFKQLKSNSQKQELNTNKIADIENIQPKIQSQDSDVQLARLFTYNKQEIFPLIIGLIAALANGCVFPVFSLFLARMITILASMNPKFLDMHLEPNASQSEKDLKRAELMGDIDQEKDDLALIFFLIGVATLVLWSFQTYFLSYVGEKVSKKLREDTYRKLMRMPIPYFDEPKNNAGTLTSRLSVDCKLISSLARSILGIHISNLGAMASGLAIAFYSCWYLTLIMFTLAPLSYLSGKFQSKFLQGFSAITDEAYKDSGNLIMEAVTNIRTVYSFGNEQIILNMYSKKVQLPLEQAKRRGIYAGLAYGFSQMQVFIKNAIIYIVGAAFVWKSGLTLDDMFRTIFAVTFAAVGAGNNAAFAGDMGSLKNAAKNIFIILDSEDEFQREDRLRKPHLKMQIKGNIEMKNLTFKYASRDKHVFQNLSLSVKEGQKVAFVGPSGCGKSTLVQMLMRFYDPNEGIIMLDGTDIADYDIRYLRRQFGIVSQEPVLFNGTIRENIQYNLEKIEMEVIEEASKQANAYEFISKNQFDDISGGENKFGQGFDRKVGPKGSQISGGQKQRIAIARAILRKSNLLLLDEATSALDAQSEQLVQDSLNQLMSNKTTVAIAHRISTIKDSDMIYVFEDGKIVEQGNYQQLMNNQQNFYRLERGIAK